MIWIRIFLMVLIALLTVYFIMLLLQCFTSWFNFTNREITFGRCLIPFYYWIAPMNEKDTENYSDFADEEKHETKEREEKIKNK